jgi:hypothetical protein
MGFWAAVADYALYMGNPREWERRRAAARVATPAPARRAQPARPAATSGGVGRVVRNGAATVGIATSVAFTGAQAYDDPAQNGLNTQGNYVDSEAESRGANQARGHRQETTYQGYQRGGSSRTD